MNLLDYKRSNDGVVERTAADYDDVFTKEAAKHNSFKELEASIDPMLLPEFNKWANKLALDRNKLKSSFNEKMDH